jgi:hypothetical protein
MIGHHRSLLIAGQINANDRFPGGSSTLSRESRALRLRSPLDKPIRSVTDVLLDALGYQARQPHQEDVFTSNTDALRGVTRGRSLRRAPTAARLQISQIRIPHEQRA